MNGFVKGGLSHSVFSGAWTSGIGDSLVLEKLGVFENDADDNKDNIFKEGFLGIQTLGLLVAKDWDDARNSYDAKGQDNDSIMKAANKSPIVPFNANPTLWLLTFCEISGMKWGNSFFLRKRFRGGNSWTAAERQTISNIYKISNVVERINAISWKSQHSDKHMYFHYWGGQSVIPWAQIEAKK